MRNSSDPKVLLLLLAVVLMFLLSVQKSITGDEALSAKLASSDRSTILTSISADNHVPGWYGYLSIWIKLFGNSLLSLRLSSLFIVLIMVSLAIRYLKFEAALVLAFSPFLLHLSLEIRMYGLLALCGLLLIIALREFRRTPGVRTAVLTGLAVATAVWVHHFGWLGLPAALTIMLADKKWREAGIAAGVPLILYIPWLSRALQQWEAFGETALSGSNAYLSSASVSSRLLGIPFSLGGTVLRFSSGTAAFDFGLFEIRNTGFWLIAGIVCTVWILFLVFKGINRKSRIPLSILCWTVLPLCTLRPSARHFALAFPAFMVLAGNGLARLRMKWKPAIYGTPVLLLLMSVPLILRPTIPQRCTFNRDFREAVELAASASEENNIPVVIDLDLYTTLAILYHFQEDGNAEIVMYHPHEELLESRIIFYPEVDDALSYLQVNTDSLIRAFIADNREGFVLLANDPREAGGEIHGSFIGLGSDIMSDCDLWETLENYAIPGKLELYNSSGPFSVIIVEPR